MIRAVLWMMAAIVGITLLRAVIGILSRFLSSAFSEDAGAANVTSRKPPAVGTLHKDPVCGIYVPESVSVKLKSGGDIVHFCSDECLRKYQRPG